MSPGDPAWFSCLNKIFFLVLSLIFNIYCLSFSFSMLMISLYISLWYLAQNYLCEEQNSLRSENLSYLTVYLSFLSSSTDSYFISTFNFDSMEINKNAIRKSFIIFKFFVKENFLIKLDYKWIIFLYSIFPCSMIDFLWTNFLSVCPLQIKSNLNYDPLLNFSHITKWPIPPSGFPNCSLQEPNTPKKWALVIRRLYPKILTVITKWKRA